MLLEGLRTSGRAIKPITTVIDPQSNSENGIVQSIERAQVMATTRMHGALYALAYGCPVVAVDQISGGAKVSAILEKIGWPLVFRADLVDDAALRAAFEKARSPEIVAIVDRCRADAIRRSKIALAEAVRLIVH
jgi:polysaccharide pyruvyl transferase WcaK-like protein